MGRANVQWLTFWGACSIPAFVAGVLPRRTSTGVFAGLVTYAVAVFLVELLRMDMASNEITLDGDGLLVVSHGEETILPAAEVNALESTERGVVVRRKGAEALFVPGLSAEQTAKIREALGLEPATGSSSPQAALAREADAAKAVVNHMAGVRVFGEGLPTAGACHVDRAQGPRGFRTLEKAGWATCVGLVVLSAALMLSERGTLVSENLPTGALAAALLALVVGTLTGCYHPERPREVVVYDDRLSVDYGNRTLTIPASDIRKVSEGPAGVLLQVRGRRFDLVLVGLEPGFAARVQSTLDS